MSRVLVSAHRGGAGNDNHLENTLAAFEQAIALGCDFIEFDVRRTADELFVILHQEPVNLEVLSLTDTLATLKGRAKAQVDLKFAGEEIAAVAAIVSELGPGNVIITTAEDDSVRSILEWSHTQAPGLLVGLSTSARGGGAKWQDRISAWCPRRRLRRSGANLVASHHILARFWLRSYARRHDLPLLVWTVDDPCQLARWMNDPQCWVVTTNHPARAFAARRHE